MDVRRAYYESLMRTPPQYRFSFVVPGKDAFAGSEEKSVHAKITTDCQKTVFSGKGRQWKAYFFVIKSVNGHNLFYLFMIRHIMVISSYCSRSPAKESISFFISAISSFAGALLLTFRHLPILSIP